MSFVVKDVHEITVPVVIHVPGEAEESRISATWTLYPVDEGKARVDQMQAGEISDEQLVAEDLQDAGPFLTPEGKAIPFTPELAQQLLQKMYVRRPLINSWFAAQNARTEEAAKN